MKRINVGVFFYKKLKIHDFFSNPDTGHNSINDVPDQTRSSGPFIKKFSIHKDRN